MGFSRSRLQVHLTEIEPVTDIGVRQQVDEKQAEPVRNRAVWAGEGLCHGIPYQFLVRLSDPRMQSWAESCQYLYVLAVTSG